MPDFDSMYPSRFLKGTTIADRPRPIRIVAAMPTTLEGEKGEKATCVIQYRAPWSLADGKIVDKPGTGEIVWCKSNAWLTAAALGGERDYTKWQNRVISIWFDPSVRLGNKVVGGIRVFGSPELTKAIIVDVKRPRRSKPDRYRLVPTDARTGLPKQGFEAPEQHEQGDDGPPMFDEPPMEQREPGAEG